MDSYTLIAKMRRARRAYTLSVGAQALYNELVAINNEEKWSETFNCTAGALCGALNVSEKTLGGYRDELITSQLVGYISGQSKRAASTYCLFGSRFGVLNGSNIGGNIYHQTEHQIVENTPDYNKHKVKHKLKHINDDDNVIALPRKIEIDEAITEYFSDRDNPSDQTAEFQKEKSSAKKEKVLPTVEQATEKLQSFELWRHVMEHHQVTEEQRAALFKHFYEYNTDTYKIRYPTASDMVKHFYNWVPIHQSKNKLQELNQYAGTKRKPGGSNNSRADKLDERNRGAAAALARITGKLTNNQDNRCAE